MQPNTRLFLIKAKRCVAISLDSFFVRARSYFTPKNKEAFYYCPCCQKYSVDWIDWSPEYRKVICPHCYSFPRHRLLFLYLKKETNLDRDALKVLHFAPEPILRQRFSKMHNLDYITADLNNSSVDIKIDITDIPYPNNTFDVIICNHVLEHVVDDRKAMSELFRILRPGGWASLSVPIRYDLAKTFEDSTIVSPEDRVRFFGQEDHVRWYGLDYKDRLKDVGFTVNLQQYAQSFNPELVETHGLHGGEPICIAAKPVSVYADK